MPVYLDTCIVIYAIEGEPTFHARAQAHIATLQAAGHRFAVSDLTVLECLVKPMGVSDGPLLLDYERFFLAKDLTIIPLTASIYRRAAHIRGAHHYTTGKRYSLADSVHLAVAVESGCHSLVTNDTRLNAFPDVVIDVLP